MEVIVLYNIVFINRDTMTRVMSLPIKTVMEYKAHNMSLTEGARAEAVCISMYMLEIVHLHSHGLVCLGHSKTLCGSTGHGV